jgi:hypothetical protein
VHLQPAHRPSCPARSAGRSLSDWQDPSAGDWLEYPRRADLQGCECQVLVIDRALVRVQEPKVQAVSFEGVDVSTDVYVRRTAEILATSQL